MGFQSVAERGSQEDRGGYRRFDVHALGITGLLDMVYNGGDCTVLILDNRTTAMTGRQNHPGRVRR
jgi:hypothetical protein